MFVMPHYFELNEMFGWGARDFHCAVFAVLDRCTNSIRSSAQPFSFCKSYKVEKVDCVRVDWPNMDEAATYGRLTNKFELDITD